MSMRGGLAGRVNENNAKWWVLGASCFALFMAILDNLVVNVALPTISEDFSPTTTQLQWIVSAYTLIFAALQITAGGLGDRFGRKRFFLIGVTIFTVTSALAALVQNTEWLIIARAVQGFGAAFIMPLSLSLISAAFPPEERGKALGIWSAVSMSGLAFGPIVGGFIVENFAWQWIFLINVPIGIIAFIVTSAVVSESRDESGQVATDIPGTVLVTGAIGSLTYAGVTR
jgi:EmrB/QacA subfamily drug resistance transporter